MTGLLRLGGEGVQVATTSAIPSEFEGGRVVSGVGRWCIVGPIRVDQIGAGDVCLTRIGYCSNAAVDPETLVSLCQRRVIAFQHRAPE